MTGAAQAMLSASGSGGPAPRVNISDQTISYGGPGSVGYGLLTDGNAYKKPPSVPQVLLEAWLLSGAVGDYQVRATPTSGTLTSGTTGSWLPLSTDQHWVVASSGGVPKSCTLLVEIRDAVSLTVLDSATVALTATG